MWTGLATEHAHKSVLPTSSEVSLNGDNRNAFAGGDNRHTYAMMSCHVQDLEVDCDSQGKSW